MGYYERVQTISRDTLASNNCYYIIYDDEGKEVTIPDPSGGDVDYSFQYFFGEYGKFENDWSVMKQVNLNKDDYWIGYFYFNDMEDPQHTDECDDICFNTKDHLELYWGMNDCGGHYDCLKIEHWVDGDLKEHFNPDEFEVLISLP